MTHDIALIALDGVHAMDLGMPAQVFGGLLDESGAERYRVRVCSPGGGAVETTAGFTALLEHDLSIVAEADTVIVLPGLGARAARPETLHPDVRSALLGAQERGARVVSICTGAFVLAAAGMLDGRRATTYWRRTEEFRSAFPRVRLEPDVLYVDDGILTSAGVAAGLDLCLHLVSLDFGIAAGNDAARRLVMAPRRSGGQAQFIDRWQPADDGDRLSDVLAWASAHLHETLSVETLARRAAMSERTFTRRFREQTGTSPTAWITTERLARARELLEGTDLYIDEIARLSGLGSGTHLRAQFQRRFGQSPTEYRRVFRPVAV
jgi:transcriptional regulator GlxA family with amidase domain